jgi:DNA-binding beta-propeller fold protein YncE
MPIVGGLDVDPTGNVLAVGKVDVDPDPVRTVYEERVRKFDASGNVLAGWGKQGTGPGEFQSATDVAIGPHGHVFVVDEVRARIIEFDATGNYVREFGSRGPLVDQFDRPWRLVFGSGGDLYVTDRARDRVFKYRVP